MPVFVIECGMNQRAQACEFSPARFGLVRPSKDFSHLRQLRAQIESVAVVEQFCGGLGRPVVRVHAALGRNPIADKIPLTTERADDPIRGSRLNGLDVTAAGGLTLGADPMANALSVISFQRGKPVKSFIVRKETKDHGTKSRIEGTVKAGESVVILDDVITTGGSTLTAIEAARDAGLQVKRVIALIDREEGGRENIEKEVGDVRAVLTRTEVMAYYSGKTG